MKNEMHEKMMMFQFLLHKKRKRMMHGMLDPMHGQGRVLSLLKMKDNVSSRELMYLLGMTPPSVSELITKLEKAEYITREQSTDDKRVSFIKLTEKGRTFEPAPREHTRLFDCLTEAERETFGQCLDKLIVVLKEKLGYDDEVIAEKMKMHRHGHCHK
jgi:DNA-binding MarR family transcriptional regulator